MRRAFRRIVAFLQVGTQCRFCTVQLSASTLHYKVAPLDPRLSQTSVRNAVTLLYIHLVIPAPSPSLPILSNCYAGSADIARLLYNYAPRDFQHNMLCIHLVIPAPFAAAANTVEPSY